MDLFEVNQATCRQDGICAAVCPASLIEVKKGEFPKPVSGAEAECIACGHCVAACPTGSLSHRHVPVDRCSPVEKTVINGTRFDRFLRSRRSIRRYREKAVPKEVLTALIETARYAPTGKNSQCVEWLILANKEELANMRSIATDWMRWMIANQPETAAALFIPRMLASQEKGEDEFLRKAPVVVVTHARKDNPFAGMACPIALAHFELAAHSVGLGCCWAGLFNRVAQTFPPMIKAVALPEGHYPFGSMMVGYSQATYHKVPLRKEPPITWRL